jgi:hypothetical protein
MGKLSKLEDGATTNCDECMTKKIEDYTTTEIEKDIIPYLMPSSSKLPK